MVFYPEVISQNLDQLNNTKGCLKTVLSYLMNSSEYERRIIAGLLW